MTECIKHGPHAPGECPECDELAEARSIVATTYIPPAPLTEEKRVEKQRLPEECWIWRRPDHHLEVNFTRPPDVHEAVKYMRVLSRQEVDKIAGEGVDVQQYINSLLRTIEGQKRHIATLTSRHGPQCACAACEDKRARMTL